MDDGIADDVRKIKESMKDPTTSPTTSSASVSASTKKTRTPASAKSTPKLKQSRQSRKDKKVDKNSNKDEEKEEIGSLVKKVEDKEEINKPKSTNTELKKELLADWMDEEDVKVEDTTDEKKTENGNEKFSKKKLFKPRKSVKILIHFFPQKLFKFPSQNQNQ